MIFFFFFTLNYFFIYRTKINLYLAFVPYLSGSVILTLKLMKASMDKAWKMYFWFGNNIPRRTKMEINAFGGKNSTKQSFAMEIHILKYRLLATLFFPSLFSSSLSKQFRPAPSPQVLECSGGVWAAGRAVRNGTFQWWSSWECGLCQKHDSWDSVSFCTDSFSCSMWFPLWRTEYLKEKKKPGHRFSYSDTCKSTHIRLSTSF